MKKLSTAYKTVSESIQLIQDLQSELKHTRMILFQYYIRVGSNLDFLKLNSECYKDYFKKGNDCDFVIETKKSETTESLNISLKENEMYSNLIKKVKDMI